MSTAVKQQYANDLSVAEFIEWENQQDIRHEFVEG